MTRSLGATSSNPRTPRTREAPLDSPRDGDVAPSDWRLAFDKAYRAWARRSEQLNLFDVPAYAPLRTQLRDLPGTSFEDIFRR